jgi:triacylglycerol esterase/lipase EstA (alpha/beta hydrolase family)
VFSGLAPARRRVVLALLGAVLVAVLAGTGVLVATRLSAEEVEPVPQDALGPVLFVPGYGGGEGGLRSGDGTGDLSDTADALGDAVDAALARTGAATVDIVGYSAGGVVARLWVDAGDNAGLVRRVVTLGSPHHGTTLADLAGDLAPDKCPVGCAQLGTASDLLARLNAGDETPDGPTWVSIWTEQDRTVTPPDSARLEGALNIPVQSVCPGVQVGHGELPRDPVVQGIVLAELRAGDPAPRPVSDCPRATG